MPPPIAPPLGDLDTWKASEWTTHSHVNSRTVQYEDEAGPFRTFNNNDERVLPVTVFLHMKMIKLIIHASEDINLE